MFFNLNNDTMITEQNEIKSAEWRKKNLSKNSFLANVSRRFIKEQSERQNAILEKAVRENAIPPIKGEMTKGKVRWRGLRMMHRGNVVDGVTETWIEQRGKRITPIIRNEYSCQLP